MSDSRTSDKPKHTTVVYFHGMGSQRRYEELGRLIDALDQFSHVNSAKFGQLTRIRASLETPLSKLPREIGCVKLLRNPPQDSDRTDGKRKIYKFYEAYWAHVTAGGVPLLEVVTWIAKQVLTPLRALRTPWRLRARLRRAALLEIWPRLKNKPGVVSGDLKRLLKYYDDFEGWDARRRYPKGSPEEFFQFVKSSSEDETISSRMVCLAREWHRRYVLIELRNLFYLLTVLLALLLVGCGLAALSIAILKFSTGFVGSQWPQWLNKDLLEPNAKNVFIGVALLLSVIGGSSFLKDYFGDVQFWTTYEETTSKSQKRREILDTCSEYLTHALCDPLCDRVVIISHSLGTTVALDTILEVARRNRAAHPTNPKNGPLSLDKIQHLITIASPIDKVHYFFESHAGRYHRYNRVVEDIRGDIGTYPFATAGKPLIHWINFWDRADIIAGALHTPSNRSLPSLSVDNVEVGSFFFPNPGAAHSAYFDHSGVIETIYSVVFDDAFSFVHPPTKRDEQNPDKQILDFDAARLPQGKGEISTRPFQILMMSLPWLILAYLISMVTGVACLQSASGSLSLVVLSALVLGFGVSSLLGHRYLLK